MSSTTKIILAILLLVVALAGMQHAIGYYTSPAVLGDHDESQETVDIIIDDVAMRVPKNIIRRGKQRQSGQQASLDLYLQWPSLKGYSAEDAKVFEGTFKENSLIFITLEAGSTPNAPERRLEGIYRRFFVGNPWRGPDGLIGQSLDPASGYQSEDVYYARKDGDVFLTRCLQTKSAEKFQVLPTCLTDFQFDKNITVIVRYHRDLLEDWKAIDTSIKRQIISMRIQQ